MINILALSLILITLGTTAIFCPNADTRQEAHRAVVVEFEKDNGGNTKVSISPQEAAQKSRLEKGYVLNAMEKISEKADEVKQRFKDAAAVLPNVGEGISAYSETQEENQQESGKAAANLREVLSDAFKRFEHEIIAGSLGRAKEAVRSEEEVKERAKEATGEAEDGVKTAVEKVKSAARDMADATKRIKGDVQRNAYTRMEDTKVEEGAHRLKDRGKKDLKDILRRGREVLYDAFDYIFSPENLNSIFGTAHLLGLATAYGMCLWVTFISSYVLAMALPRHQFATVQTKVYPVYFKAMAYSIGTAFSGHFLSQRRWPYSSATEAYLGFNLVAPLIMVLVNLVYLEPKGSKVMFERMKMEKEEGRGMEGGRGEESSMPEIMKLSERLKKLNSQSSFLNVLTLMGLSLHVAHIAQRLHTVC